MNKKMKILGVVAVCLGFLSAVMVFLPYGLFLSLPTGFLGMVTSTVYLYYDTKHQVSTSKISPGVIGIFLSSLPIITILIIIFTSKQ